MSGDRARILFDVHERAQRRREIAGAFLADDVVDGHRSSERDRERYRWARDCERIAFVMWHLEHFDCFPQWWRETGARQLEWSTVMQAVQP